MILQKLRRNTKTISKTTRNMMSEQVKRGAFIVLEGCDRTGKTTQCRMLVNKLNDAGFKAQFMNFPDRSTQSGQLINGYLTRKDNFSDQGIHLMFTLNRWEKAKEMEKLLRDGVNLIVDRYSFSGIAFSAAKGVDVEWCKAPESGLLKPDVVIFLTLSPDALVKRGNFGDERYEVPEFQKKVMAHFKMLEDDRYWKIIDADKTINDLASDLFNISTETIAKIGDKALEKLW